MVHLVCSSACLCCALLPGGFSWSIYYNCYSSYSKYFTAVYLSQAFMIFWFFPPSDLPPYPLSSQVAPQLHHSHPVNMPVPCLFITGTLSTFPYLSKSPHPLRQLELGAVLSEFSKDSYLCSLMSYHFLPCTVVVNTHAVFLSGLQTPQQKGLYTFLLFIYSVPRKFEFNKYLLGKCTSDI